MADLKAMQIVKSPSRGTADLTSGYSPLRSTRVGELFVASMYESLAMQGRLFVANMGSVTTPLTFLATADLRPDAWIRVPSGTTVLPMAINVVLESAAGTVTEIDVRITQNDIGNGTSSAASIGPLSLRTDAPVTSACTARQLATGDTSDETNPVSIFRRTYARADEAGIDYRGLEITREMMSYPILVGAATLEVFIAATSTQATGFVVITWGEIPSADIT